MKLALVHDWLTGMRGGEKCLEVLCRRFPDAELFTLLHQPGSTSPAIERMRIRTSFLQRMPGVARWYRYLLPLMPRAIESFEIPCDVDAVVSFSHAVAKSAKPPPGVPHVCYCFTPMRYAWHMRRDYFRNQGGLRNPLRRAREAMLDRIRRWDRETSRRVRHFVAISQTVARRIEQCYGRRSTIIFPPVDTKFYTPADVPREDFYLCVSALVPYKRVDLAIRACNALGRKLLVIGRGPQQRSLARLAGEHVRFAGWQSNETIRDALRRCRALLFPGHEDFGIVPLEAQACGAPVVAFRRGGATETVLSASAECTGTGVFFDEQTPESMGEAILWLEQHGEQCDAVVARRQAERFSAERYEGELLAFLDGVAGGGRLRRAA